VQRLLDGLGVLRSHDVTTGANTHPTIILFRDQNRSDTETPLRRLTHIGKTVRSLRIEACDLE
jgi:hypothetical protein